MNKTTYHDGAGRVCIKCGKYKPYSEYGIRGDTKYPAYRSACRACQYKDQIKWAKRNKEKMAEWRREYKKNNPERYEEYDRRWQENKEKYKANRAPKQKEQRKLRYKNNGEEMRLKRRERHANDINFRISCVLRTAVSGAISKGYKSNRTFNLIGCDLEFLKKYLESKFTKGMTWNNWTTDGWHIDHIRPCASFDLKIPEEQRKCFHYSNLQPLWAKENMSKGAKYKGVDHKNKK